MPRAAILNIVGLTPRCLGSSTSFLADFAAKRRLAKIKPALPAVTCTMQSTYLTGLPPSGHGIVANGWYDRELAEHLFWKQSNHLVKGEKLWERLRRVRPGFTCAKVFWWYNMHSSADWSITPRPLYPADGRKVFDVHTHPMTWREEIKAELGAFPFPAFWGPAAGLASTRWIAESAKWFERRARPDLSLVYLPHLDYDFQRFGPDSPQALRALREVDDLARDLAGFYAEREVEVILLSEYGIGEVSRPIALNRHFREHGWLSLKNELGRETLDLGGSAAFAIADHQLAHVHLNRPSLLPEARELCASIPGVELILDREEQRAFGLDHPRSGDLVVVADGESWFTYYFWTDDAKAPDFARCVDIHRKPGYDPAELFLDPAIRFPKLRVARKLLAKKLGFRMLMDVVPLSGDLVRGSHGRIPENPDDWPILITEGEGPDRLAATDVFQELCREILGDRSFQL